MKKTRLLLPLLVLSLLFLAACRDSDTADIHSPAHDIVSDAPDTAELLNRMQEASKNIQSFRADMQIAQEMTFDGGSATDEAGGPAGIVGDLSMNSDLEMEMTMEPLFAWMKMTLSAPEMDAEGHEMEMYLSEDGVYMNQMGQWMYMAGEQAGFNPEEMKQSYMSEETVEAMREIEDNLVVTEQGDHYLLTYDGDGEDANKLLELQMQNQEELPGNMEFNHLKYQYTIEKDTYYPTGIDMDMSFSYSEEVTMESNQKITGTFSKINEVTEITIPQEALDVKP